MARLQPLADERIHDYSTDDLLKYAASSKEWEREQALDELWDRGANLGRRDPIILLAIRAGVGDPSEFVRDIAAMALGELGEAQDFVRLLHLLKDRNLVVRASAAGSLSHYKNQRSAKVLESVARIDAEPTVRKYAIVSLVTLNRAGLETYLLGLYQSEAAPYVRTSIVYGLVTVGRSEYLEDMYLLSDDKWYITRRNILMFVADLEADGVITQAIAEDMIEKLLTKFEVGGDTSNFRNRRHEWDSNFGAPQQG